MSKKRIYTGYAVVSKDILDDEVYKKGRFGISFSEHSLEDCKRYCHKGYVVVRTYQTVLSRGIAIRWVYKYPRFERSSKYSSERYIQIWHIRVEMSVRYACGYEREVVFEND